MAIVLPYFGNGGAEHMVALLASHLDLEKFEVLVVCNCGPPQNNSMEHMVSSAGITIFFVGKGLGFSVKAEMRLWKCLSAFQPDVVHTHLSACLYCAPWCMTHGVPMVHTIHNIPDKEAGAGYRAKLMRYMFRRGKAVPVAISPKNKLLTADFYGIGECKVEMVLNPVDLDVFSPRPNDGAAEGLVDGMRERYDFVTVGRLESQKNQSLMLNAMARVVAKYPYATLAIVGSGSLLDSLLAQARDLEIGGSVDFLGKRDNVQDILRLADLFLLSSDFEGLPLSVLEAMAAGLPIVSTDVDGMGDLVVDNGILVPAGDETALAAAMLRALDASADQRKAWGRASRRRARSYDVWAVASEYERVYKKFAQTV